MKNALYWQREWERHLETFGPHPATNYIDCQRDQMVNSKPPKDCPEFTLHPAHDQKTAEMWWVQ